MHTSLREALRPRDGAVRIARVKTAEADDIRSDVKKKKAPRWLWHASDHGTGKVLAYGCGRRQDEMFLRLKTLLAPFGIARFFTDGWEAYARSSSPFSKP